jgi:soluble P-type ATPase
MLKFRQHERRFTRTAPGCVRFGSRRASRSAELPRRRHSDSSFADPVRPTVAAALKACRTAGICVVMITGDYPATARAVARELGFDATRGTVVSGDEFIALDPHERALRVGGTHVFARVRPDQKLAIVQALRANGLVVAMTGDGTNDALALREADIGIAMGRRGTEVARAAADLVLLDDDFSTIVGAVRDAADVMCRPPRDPRSGLLERLTRYPPSAGRFRALNARRSVGPGGRSARNG